jgi:hypothetical protein
MQIGRTGDNAEVERKNVAHLAHKKKIDEVERKKRGKHGTQEENPGNYGAFLQGACVPGGTQGMEVRGPRSVVGVQRSAGGRNEKWKVQIAKCKLGKELEAARRASAKIGGGLGMAGGLVRIFGEFAGFQDRPTPPGGGLGAGKKEPSRAVAEAKDEFDFADGTAHARGDDGAGMTGVGKRVDFGMTSRNGRPFCRRIETRCGGTG